MQMRRLVLLGALLGAAFAGLCYRLVDLQVLRHADLNAKSQVFTHEESLLPPQRGDIVDIKGNLLATSVPAWTVCADPWLIGNRQTEVARAIAPFLQLSETEIVKKINSRTIQNTQGQMTNQSRYVLLKRKVPMESWQKIKVVMNNLSFGVDEKQLSGAERTFYRNLRQKGVYTDGPQDQLRIYPHHALASHVLGFVGASSVKINGELVEETTGKEGIEATFNSKLAGVRGWRITGKDRRQREIVPMREQDVEPRDGLRVVLTIDSAIQHIVEAALAEGMEKHSPQSISGIVVRPRTGEILAMATLPNFDPNHLDRSSVDARRNRIITDAPEPGSTFKIVVVSGALNDQLVRLTDMFDCENRRFWFAGRELHDHESHGLLSVENIITKSSNIGAAKIGIKMGQDRLFEYIQDFGFGSKTGIPLQGESGGIVHPVRNWSKVSIAQLPMGQGIAATRLQMIMAMGAIANRGWLMRPMLVDRLEDNHRKVVAKYTPQTVRQVVSESTAKLMTKALKTVVSPEGTAPKAALEHYTVAGKTGTAQKAENRIYAPGKYFSSFLGFFPADDPELVISVMLDEPDIRKGSYYGGLTAAPIFKQIAERTASYLNIRPEDNQENVANPLAATGENKQKSLEARLQQNQLNN
jgi:cell division protein FtsI/penicillin-binding protein 2